jgi:hypothetical protein
MKKITDTMARHLEGSLSVLKPRPHLVEARRCRRKFLHFFPRGFHDPKYHAWERGYKEKAHFQWKEVLDQFAFHSLLRKRRYAEIAAHAVRIESRTNLLFSFEKMALRDAVKSPAGARAFAEGLYAWLHGGGGDESRFHRWCDTLASLPRRQTRVLTWPLVTIFGFIAQPDRDIFLKPTVTRRAAKEYGYDFAYESKPNWGTYSDLIAFADTVRTDVTDLKPVDFIDIQSFLWVQGSDEYEE